MSCYKEFDKKYDIHLHNEISSLIRNYVADTDGVRECVNLIIEKVKETNNS